MDQSLRHYVQKNPYPLPTLPSQYRPMPVMPVLHEKEHTYMVKIVLLLAWLLIRLLRAIREEVTYAR
jgi:hypothetical protein